MNHVILSKDVFNTFKQTPNFQTLPYRSLDCAYFTWILLLLGHEALLYIYARKELDQIRAI